MKEAIKILDNIYTQLLIERECGKEYSTAVKEIINYLKFYIENYEREYKNAKDFSNKLIVESKKLEKAEKEIIKQDKIIDLMSEYIDFDKLNFQCSSLCIERNCVKKCIKEYFEKKVSENNE